MAVDNIEVPSLSKDLKKNVKSKLLIHKININSGKLKLGVLKFDVQDKTYIHCPIKKITRDGIVKFGICEKYTSLENTTRNRQKLCNHKYRYHFRCDKSKSSLLMLNASKSIEQVLLECSK